MTSVGLMTVMVNSYIPHGAMCASAANSNTSSPTWLFQVPVVFRNMAACGPVMESAFCVVCVVILEFARSSAYNPVMVINVPGNSFTFGLSQNEMSL